MLYFIKWVFCWVFLFRAPCKHNFTGWHILEDSTVKFSDGSMYGIIVVGRTCRSCYSEETRRHTTGTVRNEKSHKAFVSTLRKYVLDVYGITNHKEEE